MTIGISPLTGGAPAPAGAPTNPDLTPAAMLGGGARRACPPRPPRATAVNYGLCILAVRSNEGVRYIGAALRLDADQAPLQLFLDAFRAGHR